MNNYDDDDDDDDGFHHFVGDNINSREIKLNSLLIQLFFDRLLLYLAFYNGKRRINKYTRWET